MKQQQALRWERTRQIGKKKFIVYYGFCGMGLFSGLLVPLIGLLLHNEPLSWSGFMIPLIIFPLGGLGWGSWMWSSSESRYGEYTKNAISKQA